MPGYPTIPTRNAFGPTREDDGIAPNDPNYVGSGTFNLLFHQVAGQGVVGARAYLRLSFASGVATVVEHGEAWAPNGDGTPPAVNKDSAGFWEIEYAASYSDERGTSVDTELRFAEPIRQSDDADHLVEAIVAADKRTVELRIFTRAGGTAVDPADTDEIVLRVF